MATVAVLTEGLTKDYGNGRGVFDLHLEVRVGEVFGYLGPNGAGKSTTIRMLLDMVRPTAGRVRVLGHDPRSAGVALRRRISYLPGELSLWTGWSGRQIIAYLTELHGGADPARIEDLARRFDLGLDRVVGDLSKGNKQKVGLVAAFAVPADLMILDEPTSGLDPLLQLEFVQLVREVADAGTTVLLSSHVLSEVEHVATRVGIIRDGRLAAILGIEDLQAQANQVVEVTFAHAVPPGLDALDGVTLVAVHDTVGRFGVAGSMDAFVKALAAHTVVGLRGHDADLEQVFLGYYRDGAVDTASGDQP